jgi:hypothetical protein
MQKLISYITKHLRRINSLVLRQFAFKEFAVVGKKLIIHRKMEVNSEVQSFRVADGYTAGQGVCWPYRIWV